MKKMYVSYSLLALALIACVPSYAAQAAKEQHEKSRLAQTKAAAKKQFNESIARFKKCLRGKCSKVEAFKAARDLGIAALSVAAVIGISKGTKRHLAKKTPKASTTPKQNSTRAEDLEDEEEYYEAVDLSPTYDPQGNLYKLKFEGITWRRRNPPQNAEAEFIYYTASNNEPITGGDPDAYGNIGNKILYRIDENVWNDLPSELAGIAVD